VPESIRRQTTRTHIAQQRPQSQYVLGRSTVLIREPFSGSLLESLRVVDELSDRRCMRPAGIGRRSSKHTSTVTVRSRHSDQDMVSGHRTKILERRRSGPCLRRYNGALRGDPRPLIELSAGMWSRAAGVASSTGDFGAVARWQPSTPSGGCCPAPIGSPPPPTLWPREPIRDAVYCVPGDNRRPNRCLGRPRLGLTRSWAFPAVPGCLGSGSPSER